MHAFLFWILMVFTAPPTISSVDPGEVWAGTAQFTLTVNGTNFKQGAEVRLGTTALATSFVSQTRITAVVPTASLTTAGTHQVTVFVPGGQGGTSNGLTLTVLNPPPSVSSLSPTTAQAFSTPINLTVNGANFVRTSTVRFRGSNVPTTFVSSTRLIAVIPAAELAQVGPATVHVTTPAPGGGFSTTLQFQVTHPTPTITSLSPSETAAQGNGFTLTVNGNNFLPAATSTVLWKGVARTTTFVSSTRVTASIPASDLTTAGSANVAVRTRVGDSERTSNPAAFTVTAAAAAPPPTNLPPQVLPVYGGSGGSAFTRDCGAGRVMTGLRYRAGVVVDALVLLCRTVSGDGTLGVESTVGGEVGGGGAATNASCSTGEVVAAAAIYYGTYVDGITLYCHRWIPATRSYDGTRQSSTRDIGRPFPLGNKLGWAGCGEVVRVTTQPVRSIRGRAQNVIDALGITCDEP